MQEKGRKIRGGNNTMKLIYDRDSENPEVGEDGILRTLCFIVCSHNQGRFLKTVMSELLGK